MQREPRLHHGRLPSASASHRRRCGARQRLREQPARLRGCGRLQWHRRHYPRSIAQHANGFACNRHALAANAYDRIAQPDTDHPQVIASDACHVFARTNAPEARALAAEECDKGFVYTPHAFAGDTHPIPAAVYDLIPAVGVCRPRASADHSDFAGTYFARYSSDATYDEAEAHRTRAPWMEDGEQEGCPRVLGPECTVEDRVEEGIYGAQGADAGAVWGGGGEGAGYPRCADYADAESAGYAEDVGAEYADEFEGGDVVMDDGFAGWVDGAEATDARRSAVMCGVYAFDGGEGSRPRAFGAGFEALVGEGGGVRQQ
ncbi:hypothetical protein DFH09DRAFT_1182710 [Mycena vulgaris]|nr:hypothetical protein DFH09DRAFT_1182710 [Mycena vulgaris]